MLCTGIQKDPELTKCTYKKKNIKIANTEVVKPALESAPGTFYNANPQQTYHPAANISSCIVCQGQEYLELKMKYSLWVAESRLASLGVGGRGEGSLFPSNSYFLLIEIPYSTLISCSHVTGLARINRINHISQMFQPARTSHLSLFTLIKLPARMSIFTALLLFFHCKIFFYVYYLLSVHHLQTQQSKSFFPH